MDECNHELIPDIHNITAFPRAYFLIYGMKCLICDQKRTLNGKLRDMREPHCHDVGHIWHNDEYCERCGLNKL